MRPDHDRVHLGRWRPCEKRPKAKRYLHFYEDEHPISAQLFGSDPQVMADAARMVEDLGFDLVDLNLGCPAKKVVKCNGGSGLLRDLPAHRQDFRISARGGEDSLHREIPRRLERRRNRLRRTGQDGRGLRTCAQSRCTPAPANRATAATRAGSGLPP